MIWKTNLFLVSFIILVTKAQDDDSYWEDEFLVANEQVQCSSTTDGLSGVLNIPEYPITTSTSTVAVLKYNTAKKLTIECTDSTSMGLVSTDVTVVDATTANLTIFGVLDYDDEQQKRKLRYNMYLDVDNWGSADEKNGRTMTVNLQNVNDKTPTFDETDIMGKTFILTEGEDNASIYTMHGTDQESEPKDLALNIMDDNGDSFFYLTNGPMDNEWTIGVENLDYDLGLKTYSVELRLSRPPDSFGRENFRTAILIFSVEDKPDQSPQWKIPCGFVSLDESTPIGTTFFSVEAIEVDYGVQSSITYTIDDEDIFEIVPNPGGGASITNKKLIDRENMDYPNGLIEFKVSATEDVPCCTDSDNCNNCVATIRDTCTARIDDVNDNAPKFLFPSYQAFVKEDINIGDPFTFMKDNIEIFPFVEDIDQIYNSFTLSIESNINFRADPSTVYGGQTFTVNTNNANYIDFETSETIVFTISAVDKADNNLKDETEVTIHVIDVNDCSPVFVEEFYPVDVYEDLTGVENWLLITTTATDADKSPEFNEKSIVYEISMNNDSLEDISIDSSTGEIKILPGSTSPFDFESKESHSLTIRATDCDRTASDSCPSPKTVTVEVLINVLNVNDNDPRFTGDPPCTMNFTNKRYSVGDNVKSIEAEDKDNTVMFTFYSEDIPNFFDLSLEGAITLKETLDSGDVNEAEIMGEFAFDLTVRDSEDPEDPEDPMVPGPQRSATTTCVITITDENDESPIFSFPADERRTWIDINTDVEQFLTPLNSDQHLTLMAEDHDIDDSYSSVTYEWSSSILQPITEFLELTPDGKFIVKKNLTEFPFDYEVIDGITYQNLMELEVVAKDGGTPPRKSLKTLFLKATKSFPPLFPTRDMFTNLNETNPEEPNQHVEFDPATDKNNIDRPEGDNNWEDDKICYYLEQDPSVMDIFEVDLETNQITVIGDTDVDCPPDEDCVQQYQLTIAASNNCQNPPSDFNKLEPGSKLSITVTINPLNDNAPYFVNLPSYYVLAVIDGTPECRDCIIYGRDDDRITNTVFNFDITAVKASSPTLNITKGEKFELNLGTDGSSVTIIPPTFVSPEGLHGYFDLVVELTDSRQSDEAQSTQTSIKVVVMTGENSVTFGFDNSSLAVCQQKEQIKKVMDNVLEWSFTEKSTLQCNGTKFSSPKNEGDDITFVEGYFVEPETFDPKTQTEISSRFDWEYDNLKAALLDQAEILLDRSQGFQGGTHDYGLWTHPEQISWIIVGGISGFLVLVTSIFLLTAYCLRTNALERRVKALDTDAVETGNQDKKPDKIFLSALTENVPNSNEFAESGANPIWQAAMESNDYDEGDFKFDDAMSESSGDSIFIGVEDQTEFNDYAEKLKEIEVDMDLYSKVQGARYKTLDDYRGPDDDGEENASRNPMYDDSDYL